MSFFERDIAELSINPFTMIAKEWMLLAAGNAERGYNAMTVSWGHLGAIWGQEGGYPTAVIYVRPQRYTKEFVDREELFTLAEALRGEGAANVVVSLGGEGAIMAAQTGERLFCPAPAGRAEDTVGAGDSLVAGFLAAYCAGADWRGCLAAGVAAGSASSFRAGLATREEVERLLSEG